MSFIFGIIVNICLLFTSCAENNSDQVGNMVAKTYKVKVVSPNYCSEVHGNTEIQISAPGLLSASVECWKSGGEYGNNAIIGTITIDEMGNGSILFPADEFPHGPLIIRITGRGETAVDRCNLQLYNAGGISWNQGIPANAPPAATGMSLVFEDDFNRMPAISPTGKDATYAAHKPGGGDFGEIPFADPSGTGNPFFQLDTYLRIRANYTLKTTGLISSLNLDGSGITASAPCYFECRFLAQNAIGSWPAFWVMTRGVYQGLDKPADEFDVIEAYGVADLDHENQIGYWIASHVWNQGDQDSFPGVYKNVNMNLLGGGASWYQTFHTYGVLITDDYTAYYMDNIEVGRHQTTPVAKAEPLFFMINNAFGGGWPMDLSCYNGLADMYVDWVRVFE